MERSSWFVRCRGSGQEDQGGCGWGGASELDSPFPPATGLAGIRPVQVEVLVNPIAVAGASDALESAVYRKVTDADLGIRSCLVGGLCVPKCFPEAGGEGEKDEAFPTICESADTYLLFRALLC